jgi:hypothetical protein
MNRWKHWLPGLQVMGEYQAAWFASDLHFGVISPG